MTAAPDKQYVTVDVEIAEPASSQLAFSSLLAFHLLDAANHQYDETIIAGLSPSAPDGTTGLRLRVQGSFTVSGAVFVVA